MLIGIDASRTTTSRPTGTEVYSQKLIQALLSLGRHHFRLYFRTPPSDTFPTAEHRTMPFPRLWTHLRLSWEMALHPPDILFVPAHILPLIHPHASLVTVHDLGYRYFPKAHPWSQRLYLDLSTRWNAHAAAHLLADSKATKSDLISHYHISPEKVTVAYPGLDEALAPVHNPAQIEAAKARYGIIGDYYLYLGTLQPRKNLTRVIAAYAALPGQLRQKAKLVLAGKRGWLYRSLFSQVRRLGLQGSVLFLGYVADEDKATLLSGALAFVFPSLHEGFGLPVLEAYACGCPVITSTTSSLPEVAGDAALLADPENAAAITTAMQRVATEMSLRSHLIERGFTRAERFSWDSCAQTVLGVIEQVMV